MLPSKQLLLNYIIYILHLNKTEYKIKFKKEITCYFLFSKMSVVSSTLISFNIFVFNSKQEFF